MTNEELERSQFDAAGKALPVEKCLECGHECGCATHLDSDLRPAPGDLTLCIKCGSASFFDEAMRLRKPTEEEQEIISNDPEVIKVQRLIRHLAAQMN